MALFFLRCKRLNYDVEVCHLSQDFYDAYPESKYPEIMTKDKRPYTCLLIETYDDYFICVPFRSSIQHKNAFLFSNSNRSKRTPSGLDYKKSVIIKDYSFIDSKRTAVIDIDEYNEMITNIDTIVLEVHNYITNYINHINGTHPLHQREFLRRYQFTTLSYFHDILGLPD